MNRDLTTAEKAICTSLFKAYANFVGALKTAGYGQMGLNYALLTKIGFPSENNRASGAKDSFHSRANWRDVFEKAILATNGVYKSGKVVLGTNTIVFDSNLLIAAAFAKMATVIASEEAVVDKSSRSAPDVGSEARPIEEVATPSNSLPTAVNHLDQLVSFQFDKGGQVSADGTELLIGFQFLNAKSIVDDCAYSFQLSNCEIAIHLQSPIRPILEQTQDPFGEFGDVSVLVKLCRGGQPDHHAVWKVSPSNGKGDLLGKFAFFGIAHATAPGRDGDQAFLRIKGCDVKVWIDRTETQLDDPDSEQVFKKWLIKHHFDDADLKPNGEVDLCEQNLNDRDV